MSDTSERTSLLDRRRNTKLAKSYNTEDTQSLSIPLPSPYQEHEPLIFPTSAIEANENTLHKRFKWLNKRTGSYDEDRQDLVKENTGIRVWSESYSSIGKLRLFIHIGIILTI